MHRVLAIPELFDLILDNFTYNDKPSLASLSEVCTLFRQPCTRRLYRELRVLQPLARFLWPIFETPPEKAYPTVDTQTTSLFRMHADHVQQLRLVYPHKIDRITDATPLRIAHYKKITVCPNLRLLELHFNQHSDLPYADMFLKSSCLQELRLSCITATVPQVGLKQFLITVQNAKSLKLFELVLPAAFNGSAEVCSAVAGTVAELPLLTNIQLKAAFGQQLLSELGDETKLERLRLILWNEEPAPVGQHIPSFNDLQVLEMTASSRTCTAALMRVCLPKLQDLIVNCAGLGGSTSQLLSEAARLEHLRTLTICLPSLQEGQETFMAREMSPLLQLSGLTTFSLHPGRNNRPTWTDADVLEIAKSWRQLQVLNLQADWCEVTQFTFLPAAITLDGLLSLATYCPSLRELTAEVNTSGFCRPAVLPAPRHGLVALNLPPQSLAEDGEGVAQWCLARVWPRAKLAAGKILVALHPGKEMFIAPLGLAVFCQACNIGRESRLASRPSAVIHIGRQGRVAV